MLLRYLMGLVCAVNQANSRTRAHGGSAESTHHVNELAKLGISEGELMSTVRPIRPVRFGKNAKSDYEYPSTLSHSSVFPLFHLSVWNEARGADSNYQRMTIR